MLRDICTAIINNKNLFMLLTAGLYILALFSVFSGSVIIFSFIITVLFVFLLIKNLFPIRYVLIWVAIFYLGIINTSIRLNFSNELLNLATRNCEITGSVISIPQGKSENKPKFFFKADKIFFDNIEKPIDNEKILVTVTPKPSEIPDYSALEIYNNLKLTGRLSVPFKAGNPSQFDYGNYLRNHNATAVFYAKEFTKLDKKLTWKEKFLQGINDYRENVLEIHSKYLASPNLEILGGIVFGDDAVSPPKDIKESFVNSGLLHILAASGMNVAFIYGFFYTIMSVLRLNFKFKVISGMLMVIIYSLMTGLGASIIRATIMLLFVLIGKLIDRDAHSISLLSFVALLMLIYNPLFANDVGFQLSFIVTFGILIMAPCFIKFKNRFLDFVASIITIPIIAQLWVIPIQIFYFNNISLYSVFANIMSVPILMVLSFGGFISSLLSAITPISNIICKSFDFILNPLISILVNISDFWGKLPNAAIQTTHPSIIQILLYYGILLSVVGLMYKEFRERFLRKLLLTFVVMVIVLSITLIPIKSSDLEVMAFDVGNADSFLIKTPQNEYIMVDTGKSGYNGGKSQAEIIILKYLKDRGIKSLKSLIITHFDNDHSGGALDIINKLDVETVYVNTLNHTSDLAKAVYKMAQSKEIKLVQVDNNQIVYDNFGLKLINFYNSKGENDNEKSIVTLLSYKDFDMVFTGDISAKNLKPLLKNLPRDIEVLKVPHHGAVGSVNSEIIDYLNPKYSVISVGYNKFGHPSIYTLALLDKTRILRTDIDNSILFSINSDGYSVSTYDMKERKYKKIQN
ncbi:MAG: DNA internalization-related competence protein ComEC/Rec2 [Cyanobacteria bacterium SIG28]|nr:DNA internalization-related competence protein ComEC/Rec2 [Cyanobacteria bacterium SIG28]